VLAVGSVSNDFGTEGVAEHCFFLDSHMQAEKFHLALLNQFLRVSQKQDGEQLHLAIVGGGATGVELSAELYHVADLLKVYGMKSMSAKRVKISLIEAGSRILPALPARIALSAKRELVKLGVEILENTRVVSANERGFVNGDGEQIDADMMVWAAGVKAPNFIRSIEGLETARGGTVVVKPTLQSTTSDDIYVIGDCCACEQKDGSFVPPRAQAAHQMATLAFKNIIANRNGRELKSYVYHDHGSLVNLSRYSTVGNLMGNLSGGNFFIEGRIARFVYVSLYRMHQIAIHGWVKASAIFLAQKVAKSVKPKMKLH
ncbi:MAG: NAD(P)/FAD-dependent oxidoreductase, partial [Pontibacterium sp.]